MSKSRRLLAIVMCALMLALLANSASAATGTNLQGRTAARVGDNLFLVLSNNDIAGLNVVPVEDGDMSRVDTQSKIYDLVPIGTYLYYLRYDSPVYQLIRTDGKGEQLLPLCEFEGQTVEKLSFYDEMLYCLVDGVLTLIDPENGESDEINPSIVMSDYAIVNDVIFYLSKTDVKDYEMELNGTTVSGQGGMLYSVSITGSNTELLFDGVGFSDLKAVGNYLYMHNLGDSYPTQKSEGLIWLEGRLYRMDTASNELTSMNVPYDWAYFPTPSGVVAYSSEDVSLYTLSGDSKQQLMTPEVFSSVAADDEFAYVYEHTKGLLTQISLEDGASKTLYNGGPIVDLAQSVTEKSLTQVFDEDGNPMYDEDGNPVYEDVTDDDDAYDDDDDSSDDSSSEDSSSGSSSSSKKDSSYIFANSSKKKLTRSQVLDVSKSYWKRARNEIYARHGYVFKTNSLADYFSGKSWYKPGGFSTSDLNSTEWYNMELILSMEKEYGLISDGSRSDSGSSGSSSSSGRVKLSKNVFPSSSTKKLTKSQVSDLSAEKLARARNEILARHGFPFKQTKWKNYFKGTGWKSRSSFSYSELNKTEMYNIELIKKYE